MPVPFKSPKPFTTLGQVEAYLSQPRLQCLVCGALFSSLGAHLRTAHGLTTDQYRARFGIPYSCGLACPESKERWASAERQRAQDKDYAAHRAQAFAGRAKGWKAARRGCPIRPDSGDRLDELHLKSMGKAERMRLLREKLAEGADERAQVRKERHEQEFEYRQRRKDLQRAA